MGSMARGWALAKQGHAEAGLKALREGLPTWQATGARLAFEYFHTLFAEVYLEAGDQAAGLKTLEEHDHSDEEVWWIPEQHRVRAALLLLSPGSQSEAEAELRSGRAVARDHGARALELRTATAPARFLRSRGRDQEGREILSDIYAWFTEGHETPDLRQARELMAEFEA